MYSHFNNISFYPFSKKLRKGCDDDADERRRKFLERNR